MTIFHGPHCYISPAWYAETNVVPTWNYVAVQCYGELQIEADREQLLHIVRRYVEFYESSMPQPWPVDSAAPDFIDKLLDSIVGFTIPIDRIEGKCKLSQNHGRERREQVIDALQQRGSDDEQAIATLMQASPVGQ